MYKHSKATAVNRILNKLTGDRSLLSMEQIAFNYVCVISFPILVYYLVSGLFINQAIMPLILLLLLIVVSVLFYFSRYRQKYQTGIVIYAVCSYVALVINYFENSGINGPTLCIFFLTFQLLIVIAKPKQYVLWASLHLVVISALVLSEYFHPEWVPNTYATRTDRFLDISTSYIAAMVFIFFITTHLRSSFNNERLLGEERLLAISNQNKQIIAQNQVLEQANEEKNKLFSIISHDLKTPLDSIKGYFEILSQESLGADEKAMIESELLEQTKSTSDLLLNLLSWAKAQLHGVTVNLVSLKLRDVVEHATESRVPYAAKKGVKVTYAIDPLLEVIGDKDMLDIVIRNLVNNAIKFTPSGGEVYIKPYKKDQEMGVSVHDNGIGIPPEKQDEIFTLKTRSTFGTNNEKGIGLGLMMCKEFMEYQHGKIWFESKEGVGSVFYITLPSPVL